MVATLLGLRWRLLVNTLRRQVWQMVFTILGLLYALGVIAALAVGAFFLGRSGMDLTLPAVAAGTLLTLLWVLVPLLAFGVDDTLDPARFAIFTTPSASLAAGLILAGGMTIPGLLTVGGLLALTAAWSTSIAGALGWVVGSLLGFLTCLTLARLITTLASTQLRSRRGRDVAAGAGMIILLAAAIAPNMLERLDLGSLWEQSRGALAVIAWTPLGAPWAVAGAAAQGRLLLAGAYLVVAAAWLLLLLGAWQRTLTPAMTMPGEETAKARRGRGTLEAAEYLRTALRLPVPAAAVAARGLRYWRSDPRYFTQAISIILIGPVVAIAFSFASEVPVGMILAAPLFTAFLAGWAIHNDTAYDSTALWMGISAGVRGRDDRLGRAVAFLLWALPAVLVATAVVVAIAGERAYTLPVFAAVIGIFGAGLGFSLTISGLVVYPVQPPGTSPFSTSGMGSLGFTMLIQVVSAAATFALALPTLVTAVLAVVVDPAWGYVSLALSALTLGGAVTGGVHLGGRFLDRRAPEHLLAIRGWSGH